MRNWKTILHAAIAVPLAMSCSNNDEVSPDEETVYPVELVTVSDGGQSSTISSVGTIRFRRETSLGFTTSGKVSNVRFNEGDRVNRGALIAALDTTTVNADIDVTRAELERAKLEFDRIATLFEQGWVTKSQLEQSQAGYQAAQARIQQAQFASDTAKLYAPSSGIVITRNIDPGQIVAAGEPAIIFGQADVGYILRVPITSIDISKISVGMPVTVAISSIPDELFSANVSEIDGRADANTGSFFAIVQLPDDSRLKSGQIGTADFTVTSDEENIVIPTSAITGMRLSEGLVYLYDSDEQRVSVRNVLLGDINDNNITVREGLAIGDQIILRGHEKLVDRSKVKIVDRGKAKAVNITPESDAAAQ